MSFSARMKPPSMQVTVNKNDGKMTTDNMFEVTTDYLW